MIKIMTAASLLFLLHASPVFGKDFPDVQEGLCGPPASIHSYLEQIGFQLFFPMISAIGNSSLNMVYLPTPERVARQKELMPISFGVERIEVIHEDSPRDQEKARRCITRIGVFTNSERIELTDYLVSLSKILDVKK